MSFLQASDRMHGERYCRKVVKLVNMAARSASLYRFSLPPGHQVLSQPNVCESQIVVLMRATQA